MSDPAPPRDTQPARPPGETASQTASSDDPIKKLVGEMGKGAEALGTGERDLKEVIKRLVGESHDPQRADQAGFRTGVAYALQDLEKALGATFPMDSTLEREVRARALTSPGLNNPRVKALMQTTPAVMDRSLVREIRIFAETVAKQGDSQSTPQIAERIDVLENRVRLAQSLRALNQEASPPPNHQTEVARGPLSPNPGRVPGENRRVAGPTQEDAPVPPRLPQQGAVGDIMRAARMPIPSGFEHRYAPPAAAVGERISVFEQRLAEGKTDRLIGNAERSGVRAIEAAEQFMTGPGRGILDKMEAAASAEPRGMQTVMREMQPGGRYANLRTEFDNAYQQDKIFAGAYDKMVESAAQFGKDRLTVNANYAARSLDASQLDGRFQRAEEALGEAAVKIPGRTPGKSALDEMAEKVAELLHKAVDKARGFFGRDVNAEAAQQVRPSPSMSM